MGNIKKNTQLGMSFGTASGRLRKIILWKYICTNNHNICFHCKKIIDSIDDLSIEHKKPWLDSDDPVGLFFDIENIAFSHTTCNYGAARNARTGQQTDHGTHNRYKYHGCRCPECVAANTNYSQQWDSKVGRTHHNKAS